MWEPVLELNTARDITSGSAAALCAAIKAGADLRIYTEFRHNEHIDLASDDHQLVREVSEFAVTYVIDGQWAAGLMSLRQPVDLPGSFGPRPSMSFFLYNQDGEQAIARLFMDGQKPEGEPGPSAPQAPAGMAAYHTRNSWDQETNAPSTNFVYDFGRYRFHVRRRWREVYSHDADGRRRGGSLEELTAAADAGTQLKVAIEGFSTAADGSPAIETLVQCGPVYHYTGSAFLLAETHPLVRVEPAIPLQYRSGNWDCGWFLARTDGQCIYRRIDPYTLRFTDHPGQYALRWFADAG